MVKNSTFFQSHLFEQITKQTGFKERTLLKLANTVSYVGGISYDESLKKISKETKENLEKLLDALQIEDTREEETEHEGVDDGNINYHDYREMITAPPPRELSGVNPYSMLSVPEATNA